MSRDKMGSAILLQWRPAILPNRMCKGKHARIGPGLIGGDMWLEGNVR